MCCSGVSAGAHSALLADIGPGVQDDSNVAKAYSLGLVRSWSMQLYGSVSHRSTNGASFVVLFKDTQARKEEE